MSEGRWEWRVVLMAAVVCPVAAAQSATVEFNRDIRPILSDKCYTCHGPDESKRKSKLRLDTEVGAKADLGGHFAIVPGDPARSELVRRVTASDPARRMPPVYAPSRLSEAEIDRLTRWIAQGAKGQTHWCFLAPRRPERPAFMDTRWPRSPIDYFILEPL